VFAFSVVAFRDLYCVLAAGSVRD